MSCSICCVYLHCENSRFKNKELSFFKFPFKNADKCKTWMQNCGNLELLDLDFDKLGKKVLCEKHFKPTDYFNPNVKIKRLLPHAVPVSIYKRDDTSATDVPESLPSVTGIEHLRTYSKILPVAHHSSSDVPEIIPFMKHSPLEDYAEKSSTEKDSDIIITPPPPPPPSPEDTLKTMKLKARIANQNRNVKSLKEKIRRLRKKLSVCIPIRSNISVASRTFINMQQHHRSRQQWTPAEKRLALALYYKSPSSYKFMQKSLKFELPGVSTIRLWFRVSHLRTGVNTAMVRKLAIKVKTMSTLERQCIVMFDEMSLRMNLESNQQDGYGERCQDLNKFGRAPIKTKTATLFYLQGLQCTWKLPFCFYLHATLKAEILKTILMDVLYKLFSIGLKPKVIVCDQGSIKRKVVTLLEVSPEKTFFTFNNNDIHVCFDTNHLIKSLRNNFSNEKYIFKVGEQTVRWSDVVRTYDIDCHSHTDPALLKLSRDHIYPKNSENTKVKLATQVFSTTVVGAIRTASATGLLNSESACSTSAFIKKISDIFDCLNNNHTLDCNPSQIRMNPEILLKSAIPWVKSITVEDAKTKKNLQNIFCLNGLLHTIISVLNLWTDLSNKNECKYLLTGRINQDPLENVFEKIRHHGGYNSHPTCKQFRLAVQQDMCRRLQGPIESAERSDEEAANCDFDDLLTITDETLQSASENEDEENVDFVEEDPKSSPIDADFE